MARRPPSITLPRFEKHRRAMKSSSRKLSVGIEMAKGENEASSSMGEGALVGVVAVAVAAAVVAAVVVVVVIVVAVDVCESTPARGDVDEAGEAGEAACHPPDGHWLAGPKGPGPRSQGRVRIGATEQAAESEGSLNLLDPGRHGCAPGLLIKLRSGNASASCRDPDVDRVGDDSGVAV